jgi:hypothetical protein
MPEADCGETFRRPSWYGRAWMIGRTIAIATAVPRALAGVYDVEFSGSPSGAFTG